MVIGYFKLISPMNIKWFPYLFFFERDLLVEVSLKSVRYITKTEK